MTTSTTQTGDVSDGEQPEQAGAAAQRLGELLEPERIDALLADAEAAGVAIDGPDGLISRMIKAVLERGLEVEMADHLGYDRGDPVGGGSGNSRNGFTPKTVITTAGQSRIQVPRDRNGSFEPQLVPKRTRRLGSTSEMILSLYARGMTTRDIKAHLGEVYGVEVSHETVAKVTDVVIEEVRSWQSRPVEEVYPIVFVDGIRIKVRDSGAVTNKVAHLVVGVDVDGFKHVLGIWLQDNEGAKFWLSVFTELRNRGLRDALIVCCDGTGASTTSSQSAHVVKPGPPPDHARVATGEVGVDLRGVVAAPPRGRNARGGAAGPDAEPCRVVRLRTSRQARAPASCALPPELGDVGLKGKVAVSGKDVSHWRVYARPVQVSPARILTMGDNHSECLRFGGAIAASVNWAPTVPARERGGTIHLLTVNLIIEVYGWRFLERKWGGPDGDAAHLIVGSPPGAEERALGVGRCSHSDRSRISIGVAPDVRAV